MGKLICFEEEADLVEYAVKRIRQHIQEAMNEHRPFMIAFCGGRSPKGLLRAFFSLRLPWRDVIILQTDERYVPPNDKLSNQRMVRSIIETHAPEALESFLPMDTGLEMEEAAQRYEKLLRGLLPEGKGPDVVVLGLGDDCHVASLFPGFHHLKEDNRWVLPVEGPGVEPPRITLTPEFIRSGRYILLLVIGRQKRSAYSRLVSQSADVMDCPGKFLLHLPQTEVLLTADACSDSKE